MTALTFESNWKWKDIATSATKTITPPDSYKRSVPERATGGQNIDGTNYTVLPVVGIGKVSYAVSYGLLDYDSKEWFATRVGKNLQAQTHIWVGTARETLRGYISGYEENEVNTQGGKWDVSFNLITTKASGL